MLALVRWHSSPFNASSVPYVFIGVLRSTVLKLSINAEYTWEKMGTAIKSKIGHFKHVFFVVSNFAN